MLCGGPVTLSNRTKVTAGVRQDLLVWIQFLEEFNRVSFGPSERNLRADFQVQTDATGLLGFGIYFMGRLCMARGVAPGRYHPGPNIPGIFPCSKCIVIVATQMG